MAALDPITGTLGQVRAAHLLRRVTFGPTKQEIDQYAGLTINQAMIQIFQSEILPEPPQHPVYGIQWLQPESIADDDFSELNAIRNVLAWWVDRMKTGGTSILEKMTFFLHTHFTTKKEVVPSGAGIFYQNQLMRQYALGNFKVLSKKICLDNAMIIFLDSRLNKDGNPNENFGREYLELYTIGKGPQIGPEDYTNYTEQDVKEAARVLSGYTNDRAYNTTDLETGELLDPDTGFAVASLVSSNAGVATQHDAGEKVFSDKFGNATISPTEMVGDKATVTGALDELDQLVNMIFDQEETAKHICRKLYRFFMYYEITDYVENEIITPLANTFRDNDYELLPVLQQLLSCEHFFDEDNADLDDNNQGALIKSPLEVTIGAIRFLGVQMPTADVGLQAFYDAYREVINHMELQGMDLYDPFEVAGYSAYHQTPGFNRYWISVNNLARRYDFIDQLSDAGWVDLGIIFDVVDFVSNAVNDPSNAREVVTTLVEYLFPEIIKTERYNYFLHAVFLGVGQDELDENFEPVDANNDFTDDWQRVWDNGDDNEIRPLLTNLIRGLIQSPEYQLF